LFTPSLVVQVSRELTRVLRVYKRRRFERGGGCGSISSSNGNSSSSSVSSCIGPAPRRLAFHYHCSSAHTHTHERDPIQSPADSPVPVWPPALPRRRHIPVIMCVCVCVCIYIIMYIRCNTVSSHPFFPSRRRRRRSPYPLRFGSSVFRPHVKPIGIPIDIIIITYRYIHADKFTTFLRVR